jgi:hypothetical protein
MHIISKLNELKKKSANYHEELRYIESYLNESQNEIAKHKEEYDNLLSSIETYINLITKSKYHLSMLK